MYYILLHSVVFPMDFSSTIDIIRQSVKYLLQICVYSMNYLTTNYSNYSKYSSSP